MTRETARHAGFVEFHFLPTFDAACEFAAELMEHGRVATVLTETVKCGKLPPFTFFIAGATERPAHKTRVFAADGRELHIAFR
jgi:hypothetical protein